MEGIRTAADVERCIKTKRALEAWKRMWIDPSAVEFFVGSERAVVARTVVSGVHRKLSAPFERPEHLGYSEPLSFGFGGRLVSARHHGKAIDLTDPRAAWNPVYDLIPAARETIDADEKDFRERLTRLPPPMSFWNLERLYSEEADLEAVWDFLGALNKVEELYREIFLRERRPLRSPIRSSGLSRLEGLAAGAAWER